MAGAVQLTDAVVFPYVAGRLAVTDVGAPGANPIRNPNLLVEPLPIRFINGMIFYANLV
jgi:hypothetical protein